MAAAAACAYAFQGARPPPARSSPHQVVPESPPFDDIDDSAIKPASPVVHPPLPPPPQLPPSFKAPPSLFSRHPGLCTEGLGSESSCDLDLDDDVDNGNDEQVLPCNNRQQLERDDEPANTRISGKAFPPPISVIGAGGKPWLYLRPHRAEGRLVLREVRIPSQDLLQVCREDGRFKLHFAAPQPEEEDQFEEVPQCQDAMVKEQEQGQEDNE
jgi:hypothetical protein